MALNVRIKLQNWLSYFNASLSPSKQILKLIITFSFQALLPKLHTANKASQPSTWQNKHQAKAYKHSTLHTHPT